VDLEPVQLVTKAADFAARAHAGQRRKDASQLPYINHLIEVANLLATARADANLVAAGYLHDTIEDQNVSYDALRTEFGEDVADLVRAVTDDKSLPKGRRKNLQVEHAAHASPRVANLKVADKISNLRSIHDTPPANWPEKRIEQYIAWADAVVRALHGVQPELMREYEAARSRLLAKHPAAAKADPKYPEE
jgi:(p)ppGpp synthase/HD superfamily hydrolase